MKTRKILIILFISFVLINCINLKKTYAANIQNSNLGISIEEMFKKAENFKNKGQTEADKIMSQQKVADEFKPVGQILVVVANAVVFIVVGIMGIKWITANPEQQGKLKQQLIGLVVSIFVIYGAVGIWALVITIMNGI